MNSLLSRLASLRPRAAAASLALALSTFCLTPDARAQEPQAPAQPETAPAPRRPGQAANLLLRLNLSPEQLRQLREVRRQSEPEARALTRRLNLARRALDEAINADALDEALVEERTREFTAAQAALARLRAQTELRVRRILTPEQLRAFRDLRQQARLRQRAARRQRRGDPAPPDDSPDARPPRAPRARRNVRP